MRIAILGSGIVGQATGKGFARLGHDVVFSDIDGSVLQDLRHDGYTVAEPGDLAAFRPSISFVCVPTPTREGDQDTRSLVDALADVARMLRWLDEYHLVVVKSSVLPTTTEKLVIPTLERLSGQMGGREFGVCTCPEFLREAIAEEDSLNPRVVVIGQHDDQAGGLLESVYEPLCRRTDAPIIRTDPTTAEMIKYMHNLFNAAKISFFNELHSVCQELGIDSRLAAAVVARSAEGMWNPAYGTCGGYPYDGKCLPKDTEAFLAFARANGWDMPMLSATVEVNHDLKRRMNGDKEFVISEEVGLGLAI